MHLPLLQGHDDAALQCYTLAAALQPQLAAAWCRLGTACRDKGQYRQAVQAYSRALALEPEHSEAVAGLTLAKQVGGGAGAKALGGRSLSVGSAACCFKARHII